MSLSIYHGDDGRTATGMHVHVYQYADAVSDRLGCLDEAKIVPQSGYTGSSIDYARAFAAELAEAIALAEEWNKDAGKNYKEVLG